MNLVDINAHSMCDKIHQVWKNFSNDLCPIIILGFPTFFSIIPHVFHYQTILRQPALLKATKMTKGELYLASRESDSPVIGQEFSGLMFSNEHMFHTYSGYEIEKDSEKHSFSNPEDTNNNNIRDFKINIVEYDNNLQDDRVRKKLVKALSTEEPDENLDIENMDHYLLVAKRSNLHNTLICCENKLISNLNTVNCNAYYNIAQEYELRNLQSEALAIIKRTGNPDECSNIKIRTITFPLREQKFATINVTIHHEVQWAVREPKTFKTTILFSLVVLVGQNVLSRLLFTTQT
ncbi:unnamed protein product [Mytilus edulis]|uniref:Uncharacterized protein n=1 Tax=Mytilus edulis TaxID=6550 RepID=A0A8S3QKI2_MYTED|nr:unnamed protein product [Mytilus edulis]